MSRAAGRAKFQTNPHVRLSKTLSFILRHGAQKVGLQLQRGGYLYIDDLLKLNQLKHYTLDNIMDVVETDDKKRFHIEEDQETHRLKIRANQGHSVEVDDLELTPLTDSGQYPNVIHGTYMKYWQSIKSEGLKRMKRTYIHFAPSEPEQGQVISGMRQSCDVVIYVNLPLALSDGLKFYVSANGVILTPGNENGILLPKYFKKVIHRKTREELLF